MKNFTKFFENVDPFGEEEWEDVKRYIYKIGTGRDFDLVGYVLASSEQEAIQLSKDRKMVPEKLYRFLRAVKVRHSGSIFSDKKTYTEEEGYEKELRYRLKDLKSAKLAYDSLKESIEEWRKNK
ncbi:MAG: hypothetical protein KDH96_09720 [Candidatus Riesia sp.]|nr:hypothetical protein [Candidatus Riesia sp.]